MKLSKIFITAANRFLYTGIPEEYDDTKSYFSCIAIKRACELLFREGSNRASYATLAALRLTRECGCDPTDGLQYDDILTNRQAARYAWLYFLAQISDEENLTV